MANLASSPVRLTKEVGREISKKHKADIKEHGLSHAVNVALAAHFGLPAPITPVEKMAQASRARWRAQKRAAKTAPAKRAAKRAAKK